MMESSNLSPDPDHNNAVEGKPALVTFLCVIGVVVGGIGICSPVIFFLPHTGSPAATQAANPFTADPLVHTWQMVGLVVNFALSLLLVVSAIGSMTLKPAARRGMVIWAIVGLAVSMGFYFLSLNILEPRVDSIIATLPLEERPPESAKKIGHIKAGMAIAYELLVLFVFTRSSVIKSFGRTAGERPDVP